uniref:Uncharacterized protein n=1 Tax=Rhizophora mucronata TaxID=61149 RepID=A0A2P2M8L7_RHIMU
MLHDLQNICHPHIIALILIR